jgi:hypothetical protein
MILSIDMKNSRTLQERNVWLSVIVLLGLLVLTEVDAKAQMNLGGGNPTLTINSAVAGSDPTSVLNTTTTISYRGQVNVTRITVQTTCPGQKFTLTVVATGVTKGTAQSAVTLVNGAAALNLITNIPTVWGSTVTATLNYTASALFSQGTGTDTHTVKYTLIAP